MTTPDQKRILDDRSQPLVLQLWWALRPLTSVIRFMQSGAHPDDETSSMMAALAFRNGINISYACSTRGEGGQNDLGTESGTALGALRTREMEAACDILGMKMYWHSDSPEDTITDFGFSKSGDETLGRWGHQRTLARFVDIVRRERPDILCPTFLDVPGQHGHHRAMTQSAFEVMEAAADPAFPSNLPVWQVIKLYLPAWSGAGHSYDDDEPPPPTTMTVEGGDLDPLSGWSWQRIGQQSRVYHQTQGMGRWVAAGTSQDWPLHLAKSYTDGPDQDLSSNLPTNVAALAQLRGAEPVAKELLAAQNSIDEALAGFPDRRVIAEAAVNALSSIRTALNNCPEQAKDQIVHRLQAKEVQLANVVALALGVEARARIEQNFLEPGQSTALEPELDAGQADSAKFAFDLPDGLTAEDTNLIVADSAAPTDFYRAEYDPFQFPCPAMVVKFEFAGVAMEVRRAFDRSPVVLPKHQALASPDGHLVNLTSKTRTIAVDVASNAASVDELTLDAPSGWQVRQSAQRFEIHCPENLKQGHYTLPIRISGAQAYSVRRMDYGHTDPTAHFQPAEIRFTALQAELPPARVGYIGAGRDRVGHWLNILGADVWELDDTDLDKPNGFDDFDTLVIGIFAMKFRPGLVELMPRIHEWCRQGGTLVTLYHRPWDNWNPDQVPPKYLEIGQPSLRWRVTDETAEVRVLANHPILTTPNKIGPQDWEGWVKERGLYFAKDWNQDYSALLEMSDEGEEPLKGSLLVADIGKGRHIHTSLILHHQMENLVPGAFRLMANMIARRDDDL